MTEPAPAPQPTEHGNPAHPAVHRAGMIGLAVGALGVVFGDIGTSPLYAMQTVFSIDNGAVKATEADVYGVISLVFWSITLIVSIKYVIFVMRADNHGEGGVLALAALLRRAGHRAGTPRLVAAAVALGVFGACLFYGDSVITPAISVLSAVEGVKVVSPGLSDAVLPIGVAILVVLFTVQRFGTHRVGRLFGPIMIGWFVVVGILGVRGIARYPSVLKGLSPTYVFTFIGAHPYVTFIAMGAVVLSITGAEALYADMGHFGRPPIRRAWFALVFPMLTLNYLGQGALIIHAPASVSNPFYLLVPHWAQVPMVVLATFATVIASQAVISGAYSVSRQAMRLGFLPQLTVRQTSSRESGQIYVPVVNWILFAGVLILMLGFRSSHRLATAYGIAVTGTLLTTTILFLAVAHARWRWKTWQLVLTGVVFGGAEVLYFAANVTKIVHGGWLPLLIAALVFLVMTTWQHFRGVVTIARDALEGDLAEFVDKLRSKDVVRVPGTAVFPHPTKATTPIALKENVLFNRVLHEHVVIISVVVTDVPRIPMAHRAQIDHLGDLYDGVVHVRALYGFNDDQDLPELLAWLSGDDDELDIDAAHAMYFLSRITVRLADSRRLQWRKRLFIGLARNAANPAAYFHLPGDRTVVMGSHIEI